MANRIKLALLYGGPSGEHEISLISAASVLAHLDPKRYQITPIGIDKKGRCFVNDDNALRALSGPLPVEVASSRPLDSLFIRGKFAVETDVVFPMVHGPLLEDGCLQGLLELTGVAYVGSGVLSSAIGMDKDIARRLACVDGVRSTRYRRLSWRAQRENLSLICQEAVSALGWPLFVKPCSMGSSIGIHKVNTQAELLAAIDDARRFDDEILIEASVVGREIEVAVLENIIPGGLPKVSIPGEIRVLHTDGFYSYAAKYLESDQTELDIPARLNATDTVRIQQMAADVFTRLKCRGMARVDFFVNDEHGEIIFNEINTLPGFTSISMYPKMWLASGVDYPTLMDQLIELAIMHRQHKNQLVTHYQ